MSLGIIITEAVFGQKTENKNINLNNQNENLMQKEKTKSAGASRPAVNMETIGNDKNEMTANINALNHLNKIAGFDACNSSGYILRLIVDKGERARLLDEINICQNLLKEWFENGCIDEGLRLNGVINHACGILATATNYNGVQVA